MRQYDELVPNGAERIFKAFETQSEHRQAMESATILGNEKRASRGQWMALVISLVIFALGGALVFDDHDAAGTALITVDVVGLATVFIYGRSAQRAERDRKYGT